ncbi:MAG TPA: AbrB/MazE/SpoVT family DNA-binding domain-containing protein [Thermoleophilia bacterium]|jgi:AbrB family looped-hinge helix DNA binding protein
MTQVTLSSKYQIVIPEDVRVQLDLKPGQRIQVWALDGQVVAVPVRPLKEAFGMFPGLDTSDPRDHEDRL